jgi:hypothetical protein
VSCQYAKLSAWIKSEATRSGRSAFYLYIKRIPIVWREGHKSEIAFAFIEISMGLQDAAFYNQ